MPTRVSVAVDSDKELLTADDFLPDLLFIRKDRAHIINENAVTGALDLVVEVLSRTTGSASTGSSTPPHSRTGSIGTTVSSSSSTPTEPSGLSPR